MRLRLVVGDLFGCGLPQRVNGIAQAVLLAPPEQCPKCGGVSVCQPKCQACGVLSHGAQRCPACRTGVDDPRRVWCLLCGWDAFLVRP